VTGGPSQPANHGPTTRRASRQGMAPLAIRALRCTSGGGFALFRTRTGTGRLAGRPGRSTWSGPGPSSEESTWSGAGRPGRAAGAAASSWYRTPPPPNPPLPERESVCRIRTRPSRSERNRHPASPARPARRRENFATLARKPRPAGLARAGRREAAGPARACPGPRGGKPQAGSRDLDPAHWRVAAAAGRPARGPSESRSLRSHPSPCGGGRSSRAGAGAGAAACPARNPRPRPPPP
jgi:hypothetical protein